MSSILVSNPPDTPSSRAKKSSLSVCTLQSTLQNGINKNGISNSTSKIAAYPPDLPYIDPTKELPPNLGHDLRKKLLCSESTFSIILYLDDVAAKYDLKDCECLYLATISILRLLDCHGLLSFPQDILKARVRLLEHYMCGGLESETAVLDLMSVFCSDTLQKASVLGTLVQSLYGLSLLTEQGILAWAKQNTSTICSCCPAFANWLNQLQLIMTNDSQIICPECPECSNHLGLDHLHHHQNYFNQITSDTLSSGDTLLDAESSASLNLNTLSFSSQCSTAKPEEDVEEEEEEEEEEEVLAPRTVQFSSLLYMRDTIVEEIILVSDQIGEEREQDEILYHEETFDYLEIMPVVKI